MKEHYPRMMPAKWLLELEGLHDGAVFQSVHKKPRVSKGVDSFQGKLLRTIQPVEILAKRTPLSRRGQHIHIMSAQPKSSWPELVGVSSEEAVQRIKDDRPDLTQVIPVPMGSMVTMDMREDRVRVWVARENGQEAVAKTPTIG